MCSARGNPFKQNWDDFWQTEYRFQQSIKLDTVGDPLNLFGGLREGIGFYDNKKEAEKEKIAKQLAYQKQQYAPLAPEKTAMLVEPNAELRNRRRRAAMYGVSQLRVPGPGAASGGGYSGANAPLG